jgi:hypothetical protein
LVQLGGLETTDLLIHSLRGHASCESLLFFDSAFLLARGFAEGGLCRGRACLNHIGFRLAVVLKALCREGQQAPAGTQAHSSDFGPIRFIR